MNKIQVIGRGGRVISVHSRVADALMQRGYLRRDMVAQQPLAEVAAEHASLAANNAQVQAQRPKAAAKKTGKKAVAKKASSKKSAEQQAPLKKDASE